MNQNPTIYTLFGLMILVCLVTFNFLVMAATWMLLRHQDTKGKIAPGINIRDL